MNETTRWGSAGILAKHLIRPIALLTIFVIGAASLAGAQNPSALLTDQQLLTDADPDAPSVSDVVRDWVRANSHPIRSLTAEDYSDLQFLKPILKDKRIVQLGESGHGVAEFNVAKTRLIKFLHQEMGFEVIAFESGLYECFRADRKAAEETAVSTLRSCLLAVWHARELVPLFEYVRASKKTGRPMILAGLDVQTGGTATVTRPEFLSSAAAIILPGYGQEIHDLDTELLKKAAEGGDTYQAYLKENGARLIAEYDRLAGALKQQASRSRKKGSESHANLLVASQAAASVARLIRHRMTPDRLKSDIRDEGMADNLEFLVKDLYPGKKVIVWAHNVHIRYQNEAVVTDPLRRLGTWVARRHRKNAYTLGLYMYRGKAANNSRRIYDIAKSKPGSLESILYQARKKYLFLDLSGQRREPGSEWVFSSIPVYDSGRNEEALVLKNQYDGILFFDTVSPPTYGLGQSQ